MKWLWCLIVGHRWGGLRVWDGPDQSFEIRVCGRCGDTSVVQVSAPTVEGKE